jgi:ElaB/YqjD/DUF883 family membrane-anchored ribosome-binding protein
VGPVIGTVKQTRQAAITRSYCQPGGQLDYRRTGRLNCAVLATAPTSETSGHFGSSRGAARFSRSSGQPMSRGAKETAMASDISEATGRAENATAQIAKLRAQVEALMRDRVAPALADAAGRAESAAHVAADTMRGQAEVVTTKVREQPLLAVLIAAGIGFLLGRVIR